MSTSEVNTLNEKSRQRIAAEVLELGESLFELALEYTEWQDDGEGDNDVPDEKYMKDELYAAKNEFFMALRLLFDSE